MSFEDDESITERIENYKNEKIFEETYLNNNSANNSMHESSINDNNLSKEKDFNDIKFKNSNNIDKDKTNRSVKSSVKSSAKIIPTINLNYGEKQETIMKPSKKTIRSQTILNTKLVNDANNNFETNENLKNLGKTKNDSFANQSMRSNILKTNKEFAPFEQTEEEKRDLNKLKHEIKNNLFMNYPKPEEDEELKTKVKREKWRKISKKKKVYDSLSDEEFDIVNNIFRIDPFSNSKYFLDFLVLIVVIYSVFFSPLRLIFSYYKSQSLFLIEMLFDTLMIFDLLCGFVTGYYDFEENYIVKRKAMIKNYLKTYFTLDLFSAFPFNSLIEFYILNFEKTNSDFDLYYENKHLEITIMNNFLDYNNQKIYMLLKIVRIAKFLKVISKNAFIDKIKNKMNFTTTFSAAVNRMVFFLVYFLIISHILSCIYIFLGSLAIPNWINNIQIQNSDFSDIYLASLYFNHTTIFTIGYGDVLSKNIYERTYNVLLMVVGIMIYSFAVTSLSNIIQQRDENTKNYQKNMEYLRELKIKYKFKKVLYDKIARYLKYDKNSNKRDKNDLLKELPISLRNEMILCMYDNIIKTFLFFKNFTNIEFIIKAIMCFKPVRSLKKEVLVKETDFIEEMIFIKKGVLSLECTIILNNNFNENENYEDEKVNLMRADKCQNLKIIEIRRNEHFGDVLIFLNERSPLTVKTKSKYAELFLMKKMDLVQLTTEFPDIFEQIYIKSSYNMFKIKKCIKKTKNMFYNKIKSGNKQIKLMQNINTLTLLNKEEMLFQNINTYSNKSQKKNQLDQACDENQYSIGSNIKEKLNNFNNNQTTLTNKLLRVFSEKSESSNLNQNGSLIEYQESKINPAKSGTKKKSNKQENLAILQEESKENIVNDSKYNNNDNNNNSIKNYNILDETNKDSLSNIPSNSFLFKDSQHFSREYLNKGSNSNNISIVNSEVIFEEEMKVKENIMPLINPFAFNSRGNDKTQVATDINSDINIVDLYDENFFKKNFRKEKENINQHEKIIYSLQDSVWRNSIPSSNNVPIFYNFNINNNYKIKNNQNIYVKDVKDRDLILKNMQKVDLLKNQKKEIKASEDKNINSDGSEKTEKLNQSKTLSYLNLTNIFPIEDDKIIQNVSSFTIINNEDKNINNTIRNNLSSTSVTGNKSNLCRKCQENLDLIEKKGTTKILKKPKSDKKIIISINNEENVKNIPTTENKMFKNFAFGLRMSSTNENNNSNKLTNDRSRIRKKSFLAPGAEHFKQSVIMANTGNAKDLLTKCISNYEASNTLISNNDKNENNNKNILNLKNRLNLDHKPSNFNNILINKEHPSPSALMQNEQVKINSKCENNLNNLSSFNNDNLDKKNNNLKNSNIYLNKGKGKDIQKELQDIRKTSMNFINPQNFYSDLVNNILSKKKIAKKKLETDEQLKSIKRLDQIIKKLNIK